MHSRSCPAYVLNICSNPCASGTLYMMVQASLNANKIYSGGCTPDKKIIGDYYWSIGLFFIIQVPVFLLKLEIMLEIPASIE